MQKKTEIIGWSSLLFWITLGIILFFLLPYFKNMFYNPDNAKSWLERLKQEELIVQDTTQIPVDTTRHPIQNIYITWAWDDYEGSHHEIAFYVNRADSVKAADFRQTYPEYDNSDVDTYISRVYYEFIRVSQGPLDSMYHAMKNDIQSKGLAGQQVLDYVVTAIQFPIYTTINSGIECPCDPGEQYSVDDCAPLADGTGCCNLVTPMAVYTPTEFIVKKTGDCDTKSLIAYALLRKMGYMSALIVGDTKDGGHAMLALTGVTPVIPSQTLRHNGRLYFPWEVTAYAPACRLGNMNMWSVWKDWRVVCD
jgi:hypothetical protein